MLSTSGYSSHRACSWTASFVLASDSSLRTSAFPDSIRYSQLVDTDRILIGAGPLLLLASPPLPIPSLTPRPPTILPLLLKSDKRCWPPPPNPDECTYIPNSTLPSHIFGPETDTGAELPHDHTFYLNRPRWPNSGTVRRSSSIPSCTFRWAELRGRKGEMRLMRRRGADRSSRRRG